MANFIGKAQALMRERDIDFREACRLLGLRSQAVQRKKRRDAGRDDWKKRRWDLQCDNMN